VSWPILQRLGNDSVRLGNASRNPVVGPGYQTLDVMVGKEFPITEGVRLEFRAEAFNVTNTPPLAAPNTSFGNTAFGTITRALDPRVFEMVSPEPPPRAYQPITS